MGSDRKVVVLLESSLTFTQAGNIVVPLNTWTSITVTVVQTSTALNSAAIAIVINDVVDLAKLYYQNPIATTNYATADINTIGGASTSLVGTFARFRIFTPGTLAFTLRTIYFLFILI